MLKLVEKLTKKTKRKQTIIATKCRNCDADLHGRYCHLCGQDVVAGTRRSVSSIVFNMLENVFSLDNKVLRTVYSLVFRPGKLTKEYIEGHIVRYVVPGKLFWFVSILFFAVVVSQIRFGNNLEPASESFVSINIDASANNATPETESYEAQRARFSTYAPYTTFAMIPLFALVLMLFFHRRKKGILYVDHLIFSIHYHTFVFLFWAVALLLTTIFPMLWNIYGIAISVFLIIPLFYLIMALYTVYRPRKMSLLWKIPLLSLAYFIGLVVLVILLFLTISTFETLMKF